jgi:hypothetical protein
MRDILLWLAVVTVGLGDQAIKAEDQAFWTGRTPSARKRRHGHVTVTCFASSDLVP